MHGSVRKRRGRAGYYLAASLIALALIGLAVPSATARYRSASHNTTSAARAYLMSGLGDAGAGAMDAMGAQLRGRGTLVTVGSYTQEATFAADACAHPADRIVIIGFSLGATAGAELANAARACGARPVRLVGIDPPGSSASVVAGVSAVNFVGVLGGRIAGALNTPAPGFEHEALVNDPRMQARFLAAAR